MSIASKQRKLTISGIKKCSIQVFGSRNLTAFFLDPGAYHIVFLK